MSESESPELAAFRRGVRDWVKANKPPRPDFKLPQTFLEVESKQQFEWLQAWQAAVYDAGYLGYDAPEEYGGRGVDPDRQRVVQQELTSGDAPFFVNFIALNWVLPTVLSYGTEAQKKRLIKPLLRADEIWCQGFSEPGSGSDLASLSTRAVKQPDGSYRVTGHKVWTTVAHFAKWMILLARTNPDVHKYQGLSYFLFPMDVDGVTVQPLIKMTGEGGFNQVIFDEAPMPAESLLGEEGQGWSIAMTTLMFERGAQEGRGRERALGFALGISRLVELAERIRRDGRPLSQHASFRERITRLWVEATALSYSGRRSGVSGLTGERPMALPLMNKLVGSEWNQRLTELACEMLGPDVALWLGDEHAPDGGEWPRAYMNSFGMTIGGGTSEILRNIIGERVLGLPKSK